MNLLHVLVLYRTKLHILGLFSLAQLYTRTRLVLLLLLRTYALEFSNKRFQQKSVHIFTRSLQVFNENKIFREGKLNGLTSLSFTYQVYADNPIQNVRRLLVLKVSLAQSMIGRERLR